jgi:hypothetical protein
VSGEQRGRLYVWRCPVDGILAIHGTWNKPYPDAPKFCHGSGPSPDTGGHEPTEMERIELLPAAEARAEVERYREALQQIDRFCATRKYYLPTFEPWQIARAALNPEQTGGTDAKS